MRRNPFIAAGFILLVAAAGAAVSAPSEGRGNAPRIVPFPAPPAGPRIRRVSHDAVRPVLPGARVVITVATEPGMKVTASLGSLTGIACAPRKGDPGVYTCEAAVPEGPAGPRAVRAQVAGSRGATSSLSSAIPVVVERFDPWKEPNELNVRLVPAYFASASADLSAEAKSDLAKDLDALRSHPHLPIVIEGHCDGAEPGDLEDLSRRRAEAALAHLVTLGVPKERMTIRAMGAKEPLGASGDEEARPLNRRAMVLFQPAKREPAVPARP